MLYRIIYLSSATLNFNSKELKKMLINAKISNSKNAITGILIYSDGNIIQIIEGEKENVINLYKKISTDNRHKNIIKVIENPIIERQFDEWSMGFSEIHSKDFENLKEYKSFNFNNMFSRADFIAETFLTTFLKNNRENII